MENHRELADAQSADTEFDWLTGVYNRPTLLAMLFRETDRAQRLNTAMSLLLVDIDDFSHWNKRLGPTACDQLLWLVVARITRLLRSYDLMGRSGCDEFLISLPGCKPENAVLLAERLRLDVFSVPFHVAGASIRLSACFGIAASQGRSPLVVLREAEEALQQARRIGPESIQIFDQPESPAHTPVTIFLPSGGDEYLGS